MCTKWSLPVNLDVLGFPTHEHQSGHADELVIRSGRPTPANFARRVARWVGGSEPKAERQVVDFVLHEQGVGDRRYLVSALRRPLREIGWAETTIGNRRLQVSNHPKRHVIASRSQHTLESHPSSYTLDAGMQRRCSAAPPSGPCLG
jgi:hypothetical protein